MVIWKVVRQSNVEFLYLEKKKNRDYIETESVISIEEKEECSGGDEWL